MTNFQEITASEFDTWAKSHPLVSMFQDSRWAKLKDDHWRSKFVALKNGPEILAASLVLIRNLPAGFKFWYLPRGPLFDQNKPETLQTFSQYLKKFARQNRALVVKADPNILLSSQPFKQAREQINQTRASQVIDDFAAAGWRHFGFNLRMSDTIQPRFNAVFYFSENWPNKIHKKIRAKIRSGENNGVIVKQVGLDRIDELARTIDQTAKSKQISLRDATYFTKLKTVFGDDCVMTIAYLNPIDFCKLTQQKLDKIKQKITKTDGDKPNLLAQLKNQLAAAEKNVALANEISQKHQQPIALSASVSVLRGQEFNMIYAGMDRNFNQFYATHISNFWRLNWAEQYGATRANFSGIEGTLDDPLSEFKQAFGTNVDEYVGEFTLYTYPVLSKLFDKFLPKIKQLSKKLRRRKNTKTK